MPVSSQANFELDSEHLSVASESQMSNKSGRSGKMSETSKKSRKQAMKKIKQKRNVKEGSPFEEEYLVELLQEDTKCTDQDKDQVRTLMRALIFFGMVAEANMLHGLVARVMKAQTEADCLMTVEQEKAIEAHPELRLSLFPGLFSRQSKEERLKKALDEWDNCRCYKH